MPDFPQPYLMRDWKDVAIKYDSLVFNYGLTGQYLPLIFSITNTVNYPGDNSFGLQTYVGSNSPASGESINILPAIISASLVGINKSNQNGSDWVKMIREYFNNRTDENVYLNHPVDKSGDDWWYSTMPNIFFYQIYNLYPNTIDFNYQFKTIADQWEKSLEKMGGSTAPWNVPSMEHRGWYLSTMTPNDNGVKEPESAGAIAWLLYNAYKKTGDTKYRIGSEWAMEFLNNYNSNPSYELQLAYGTYIAAKMNAELNTNYDIVKLFNWCFDVGPLRNWGAITGTWGGYDVSGLIGEVNGSNDYAFLMNTFEQAGALVPLVRYDDRFARAVGKWVLNAANASRLFYTKYLPDSNQDTTSWSHTYDTNYVIGHEALRQLNYNYSPYATGDAISGGWAKTNLSLYSSSHAGIFGGIIDTTNVPGILKLDLLKTDYFHDNAYPTFLFYNPYNISKSVEVNVGSNSKDIYETTGNSFLAYNVQGITQINIAANSAVVIVIVPAGGSQSYELNKFLINGLIVDYSSGQSVADYPPRIKSFSASKTEILKGDSVDIFCTAEDKDKDNINYSWNSSNGVIQGNGSKILWIAPSDTGRFSIKVRIDDGKGGRDSSLIYINVVNILNTPPEILNLTASPGKINLGGSSVIKCSAADSNNDKLTYNWYSTTGTINGSDSTITWTAPNSQGTYYIICNVSDGNGGFAKDSVGIEVRDLSNYPSGNLICYYPFNGNANDVSGNNNNGTVNNAVLTNDRKGNPYSAYFFNGISSSIVVANNSTLNFQNYITINFWMKVKEFFTREQYPISHGNWQNRWKVSITDNKLRWTVKTVNGVTDLDSKIQLKLNTLYNVTVLYDGLYMEIYFNGELDSFKKWSGSLLQTDSALTIGQNLVGDNQYDFSGILDDIRIFDYPLLPDTIKQLYDISTDLQQNENAVLPTSNLIYQNYPNPFNGQTNIKFQVTTGSYVRLEVFNIIGQRVATLLEDYKKPGYYIIRWDAKDIFGRKLSSGIYFIRLNTGNYSVTKKMVLLN